MENVEGKFIGISPDEKLGLDNCDREPIHIPGSIQDFGFLICINETAFHITNVSANTGKFLVIPPVELIGKHIDVLFNATQIVRIKSLIVEKGPYLGFFELYFDYKLYQAWLHRYDGLIWIEIQPHTSKGGNADFSQLLGLMTTFNDSDSVLSLCSAAAAAVRKYTDFDRVAIYRFELDYSGEVIAEEKREDLYSWIGYHFPATDIPVQARALYTKNLLRLIPDTNYTPVGLIPPLNPITGQVPDMTHSVLRSVSPIHIEYLGNIGVKASMSVSIMKNKKLWGLIACHHQEPKLLDQNARSLCEVIGRAVSSFICEKEENEQDSYKLRIKESQGHILKRLSEMDNFRQAAESFLSDFHGMMDTEGFVFLLEGEVLTTGKVPEKEDLDKILIWLKENIISDVFCTDNLYSLCKDLSSYKLCAGLLATKITKLDDSIICWFRQERKQEIVWAGNPEKTVTVSESEVRLSPRKSFEAWNQNVEWSSWPWLQIEINAAIEVKYIFMDVLVNLLSALRVKSRLLEENNTELTRNIITHRAISSKK